MAAHVESYQRRGFTILRDVLLSEEVAQLRARIDVRMEAKMAAVLGELEGRQATGAELAAAGHTVSIGGPGLNHTYIAFA
eukprot:SAG11_NODE_5376_length_1579_cov_2.433784_1_plen_80_part_00